jgi:hypothetical protein
MPALLREQLSSAPITNNKITPALDVLGFHHEKGTPESSVAFASLNLSTHSRSPYHQHGTL